MKQKNIILLIIAAMAIGLSFALVSCKDNEDEIDTVVSIDHTSTSQLNIGETATATITIVAEEVKSLNYYKVVDNVRGNAVNVTSQLTQNGNTYTYNFSYELQEFDDLHTLGFEFEVTDSKNKVNTVALVVNMNISIQSSFVKYDWKVTVSEWLGMDVLTEADSAIVYRFNEDGTYEEDLGAAYADSAHHFCYWVYKETPDNGDTLAVLRLIRKLRSGDAGLDEYYDFRITSANESEMTMYWDIAVWAIFNIKNTFTSQSKGAFQPYGTAEMAAAMETIDVLSCSTVDDALFTIP